MSEPTTLPPDPITGRPAEEYGPAICAECVNCGQYKIVQTRLQLHDYTCKVNKHPITGDYLPCYLYNPEGHCKKFKEE